jgi:putative transposase
MSKQRYTPEEILQHLRTVELETSKGLAVLDACRMLGITELTYDRWKQESGGLRVDQATRLKGLEQEHLRLKRMVADPALDLSIVNEVAAGHVYARPAGAKPWSPPSPCSVCSSAGRVGPSASSGPPLGTGRSRIPIARGCASDSSPWPKRTGNTATAR